MNETFAPCLGFKHLAPSIVFLWERWNQVLSGSLAQIGQPNNTKLFENALAKYDKDTADRWRTIAKLVGETTEEEVKRRYDILLEDLKSIESDKVPLPNYKNEGSGRGNMSSEEER
ncbi:hypothetical protein OIU76_002264 [Salix suchowensis]|nr:hypothetical protein OIU76_002264 [Salix suchowensis]